MVLAAHTRHVGSTRAAQLARATDRPPAASGRWRAGSL